MGVSMHDIGASIFILLAGGNRYDTDFARQHRPRAADGPAGHFRARLPCAGGRCDHRRVQTDVPEELAERGAAGLRRPHHHAVLCGHASPCPPVPHAGHGHGPAAAGLAEHLHVPHRGPLRRHGLRPARLPPPGHRPDHQRHDPGLHVFLPPHRRDPRAHGRAGACRRHRLRGQGQHGSQRPARHAAGDHRGVHRRDAPLAGCLPFRAHQAYHNPSLYSQLHQ